MNNESIKSRFRFGSKIASILLSASLLATTFTGLGSALMTSGAQEVYAASDYGLADNISDGNILHCFDWKISDITASLAEIAEAGFTSVQTSPVQPHDASGTWFWLYQPLGFSVGNDNGSAEDLRTLCTEADKYGIKVIVDVVANHLAGYASGQRKDTIQSDLNQDQYFHNTEFNTDANNVDWGNRWQVTHCNIGMPDLNSEHQYVQQVVAKFVGELKDLGVDGIRWDAAKHIGLPSEDCNFWPAVTTAGLYNYGEILDGPTNSGNDDKMVEYTKYINVTDDNYCGEITGSIRDGSVTTNTGKWANRGVNPKNLVYWAESHDTYCNNGWTNGLSEDVMDRSYAVLAARGQSQSLYLSRPFEKSHTSIMYGRKGSTHFTSKQVAEVNKFKNAMVGQKEYLTTGSNCYVICRGGGAVIVNASGGAKDVSVPNGGGIVPAGTYTDKVGGGTFTVTSSTITGHIGDTGIAVFYNGGSTPSPSGSVSVSPTSGSFTDTMSVTLSANNVSSASYTTSEGDSGSFTGSKTITIGSKTQAGSSVTVTVTGTKSDGTTTTAKGTFSKKDWTKAVTVYMDNASYNWSNVYAYVYSGDGASAKSMAAWPGTKLSKDSTGYFALDVTGYENGRVIFNDGTGSATNRFPADMEPGLSIGGVSMLFGANHSWTAYSVPDPDPIPTEPTITVDKASGTAFTTETTTIKLTLANATKGTYSVDGGPEKTFTGSTTVTIGEGKIGDSTVTVSAKAIGTTTKSFTFTYPKKYVVKTTSSSATTKLSKYYATNPNGQKGGKGVTISSPSDFKDSMIIAQGVANDDPRIFRGSHEAPVFDTYALYAAWDDTNLYLGWQFVNVTDVVDPAQGYPISDNGKPWNGDIPQMLLFNLGKGKTADMSKGNMAGGAYVWGLKVGSSTPIDAMMCFSSKPGVGQPALFKTDSTGYFSYTEGITNFKEGGISFKYEDGFFGSHIYGVNGNGYAGYKPADLSSDSSEWVDFLTKGHDKAQDTFYYITIPLSALGVTRSYIESTGIGVMHVSTFGEGGISSIPLDMTFLDNATEPYVADESTSQEKADTDCVTVALARIGAGSGGDPYPDPDPDPDPDPTTPLQVNFGTDKSAPQLTTTALTLKGIGIGGTAPYKYQFSVDGTVVKASNTTATYSWKPGTSGKHTIKCVITDATGATATVSKTFTAEGEDTPDPIPATLVNNSKVSATSVTLGKSVTLTGAASGGTSPYQYAFFVKKSSASGYSTLKGYSTTSTATFTPATATTYNVKIKVKDSAGTVKEKAFTVKVTGNVTTALSNTSKLSATSVALGSSITVNCAATGGTTPYQYGVYYKKSTSTSYTTAQAYSTNAKVTIKPAAATVYDIRVKVKDKAGTIKTSDFKLTVTNKVATVLKNSSTVSATSVATGSAVTITGKASGGTSPYYYAAYYKLSTASAFTKLRDYSKTATMTFKPTKAGTYTLRVKVKDAKNDVVNKDITVKATSALTNTSTLSATSVTLGSKVIITGKATGGTTPYQFAAFYKKASSTSYTKIRDYGTTTTMYFTPATATTYDVRVKVKDKAGTVKSKDFTVKVTAAATTALKNTSTISATSIKKGTTLTITGKATGGTTPYQYSAYYKKASSTDYTKICAYSTTAKMTVKPASATTYDIRVKVKDAKGTVATKDFTVKVTA